MRLKRVLAFIRKALEHKYFPLAIAIIAFVVSLPTIKSGLMLDDLIHRSVLIDPDRLPQEIYKTGLTPGKPGKLSTAIFDLFGFCGDRQQTNKAREYGALPWWAPHSLKARLWRPVSSFTHWLDYRLFPDSAELMHIHHLLWFSSVIFLIAVLYRQLLGPTWIAAFAVIMFLIDENNVVPVMFNAHRNSIMAMFFGLLCVLCHHHWRNNKSLIAAIASPILLLLSLFSAEAGIATFAFILAYAIALEKGSITKRAVTIAPAVLTIIMWRLIYNALGYGVNNMGIYIDPVNEPVRFTVVMLERLPVMLFGIFSAIFPDFVSSLSLWAKIWFIIAVVILLLLLLLAMIPLLRKSRLAVFFCLATVFAVIPFCACFPSSRNLLFASVPGFALIAMFISDVFKKASYLPKALLCRVVIWIVCIGLVLTHLPGALLGKTVSLKMTASILSGVGSPSTITENVTKEKNLVVINTPCALGLAFLPFYQAYEGKDLPKSVRALVPGFRTLEIKRTDEKTLIVKAKGGDIFSCDDIGNMHIAYVFKLFNDLFLNKTQTYSSSQIVTLPELTIEVLEINDSELPTELAFTFATVLEDDSLCFYCYDWYNLSHKPFVPPAIGQTVELPGPPYVGFSDVIRFFKVTLTSSGAEG